MVGMHSSRAPARFISSRTMRSTLCSVRRPIGSHVYKPAAKRRIMPARSISWWLMTSASAGTSLSVEIGYWDKRIARYLTSGPLVLWRLMSDDEDQQTRRRGVFWLPNLLTTAALFSGFYAIVAAIDLRFENAGIAVFVAMFFDGLDGRVARWTRTESPFGKEYDSLSDMVSFGLAPAIVTYQWGVARISEYGPLWRRIGWLVCFFYAAAAALRLARFNSRAATQNKNYFEGLPSPAAAAIVAALVWLASDQTNIGLPGLILAFVVTATAGALMISRFAYNSFKYVNAGARVRFTYIILVPLAFIFIFLHLPTSLLAIFGLYALSAPSLWIYRKLRRRSRPVAPTHE